jgi:hypothetical protein
VSLADWTKHRIQGIRTRVYDRPSEQLTQPGHLSLLDSCYHRRSKKSTTVSSVDWVGKSMFYVLVPYREFLSPMMVCILIVLWCKASCLPFVMKPRYHINYNNKTTKVSLLENHLTEMPSIHFDTLTHLVDHAFLMHKSVVACMALPLPQFSISAYLGLPDVFQTLYSLGNPTDKSTRRQVQWSGWRVNGPKTRNYLVLKHI